MTRSTAVLLAALAIFDVMRPAACAHAQAAAPFEEVPLSQPRRSHIWSYVTMATGLGLIGASYVISDRANDTYDDYNAATDPDQIDALYDQTVGLDRWSTATLLTGEALIATGIYFRFLRRSPPVQLKVGPQRCALSLRF